MSLRTLFRNRRPANRRRPCLPRIDGLENRLLLAYRIAEVPAQFSLLTPEADGNFLYVDTYNNLFGRIDSKTGVETALPIPTSAIKPNSIIVGRDGGLWFTAINSNVIGRLDLDTGAEVTIPLPSGSTAPNQIFAGPDGHLWFTDINQNHFSLGTIDPSSQIITQTSVNSYPVTQGATISPISTTPVFDHNGKIWLIEYDSTHQSHLAQYDPQTNQSVTFDPSLPDQYFVSLITGPGDSIWFAESGAKDDIGEIDADTDAISRFDIAGFGPNQLVLGPDGTFWYKLNGSGPFDVGTGTFLGEFNPTSHQAFVYNTKIAFNGVYVGPGNKLTLGPNSTSQIQEFDINSHTANVLILANSVRFLYTNQYITESDGSLWFGLSNYYSSNNLESLGHLEVLPSANVSLTTPNNNVALGSSVTYTANVTAPDGTPGTGTVYFLKNGVVAAIGNVDASGKATFTEQTSMDPSQPGNNEIKALYLGDAKTGQTLSNILTQHLQTPTTTSVVADRTAATYGEPISFTATVQKPGGLPETHGIVNFFAVIDGRKMLLDSEWLNLDGTARVTYAYFPSGVDQIIAEYSGYVPTNGPYYVVVDDAGSDSDPVSFSITAATPMLTVTASAATQTFPPPIAPANKITPQQTIAITQTTRRPVTFTATATGVGPYIPGGTITFSNGTTLLGTAVLNTNGIATLTVPELPAGTLSPRAAYSGDSHYQPVAVTGLPSFILQLPESSIVLSTNTPVVRAGENYVVTATVNPSNPQATGVMPTGRVDLYDGSNFIAASTVNASGQAYFLLTSPPTDGLHSLTATYEGDNTYSPSTSNTVAERLGVADGPHVLSVAAIGTAKTVNTLVIQFNEPVNPASALNVNTYLIQGARNTHLRVYVKQASWDGLTNTVTLHLRSAIAINGGYSLTVFGTGKNAITDPVGTALHGDGADVTGSNKMVHLTAANVKRKHK